MLVNNAHEYIRASEPGVSFGTVPCRQLSATQPRNPLHPESPLPNKKRPLGAGVKFASWTGLSPVTSSDKAGAVEACVSRGQRICEAIDHDIESDNIPAPWRAERGQRTNRISDQREIFPCHYFAAFFLVADFLFRAAL
jgi:hypothetical protein